MPAPENVPQLRAFLGMVNYYGKYIRHLASLTEPLNQLLKKGVPWKWDQRCQDAFNQCKQQISSESCLVPFDPNKALKLDCDASPVGVGAVLSHIMEDGKERPIAFASRTLSRAVERLRTAPQRSTIPDIWCQEIPYVLVWSSFHSSY